VLGQRHHDTLLSINSLAIVLRSQGRYDEAETIRRQALQLPKEEVLTSDDGMGGHGGGRIGGTGGAVRFRAGDWKCGSEGCGHHNFAKNVSCLRCGASRAGALVVESVTEILKK
jgi:hypothetical protein